MNDGIKKILIVVVLLAAIGAVIAAKQLKANNRQEVNGDTIAETNLPRLLELGSVTCIPCIEMKPIIDELRVEYAGVLKVDFIDVKKDDTAKKKYNWKLIPTQIFYDAEGNELFRHIGFYPKEKIVAKWKELGIEFTEAK